MAGFRGFKPSRIYSCLHKGDKLTIDHFLVKQLLTYLKKQLNLENCTSWPYFGCRNQLKPMEPWDLNQKTRFLVQIVPHRMKPCQKHQPFVSMDIHIWPLLHQSPLVCSSHLLCIMHHGSTLTTLQTSSDLAIPLLPIMVNRQDLNLNIYINDKPIQVQAP